MKKSIIPNDDEYCYLCKQMNVKNIASEVHHMVFGTANRACSDADGLTIHLCNTHHSMLHRQGYFKKEMQQLAEKTWLEHYNKTIDDWIKRYGKNYLD